MTEQAKQEPKVFISTREATCDECGRELFPNCPAGSNQIIAEQACLKYSGRVGRSAAAKALDEEAVRLAVIAHIRHVESGYDGLLAMGWDRSEARAKVRSRVSSVLSSWQ